MVKQQLNGRRTSDNSKGSYRNSIHIDISRENEADADDPIIGAAVTEENRNHVSNQGRGEVQSHVADSLGADEVLQIPVTERFIAGLLETVKVSPLTISSVVEFSFRYRKIQYSKWQKNIRRALTIIIIIAIALCCLLYKYATALPILAVIAVAAVIYIAWMTVSNYKAQNTDITDEERHFLKTTYKATSNSNQSRENNNK